MNLRSVPNPNPYIACILAAGDVQDRSAQREREASHEERRQQAAGYYDLTVSELASARSLTIKHGYRMSEAAEIVRRSRR